VNFLPKYVITAISYNQISYTSLSVMRRPCISSLFSFHIVTSRWGSFRPFFLPTITDINSPWSEDVHVN
jgi:hypothetical protein